MGLDLCWIGVEARSPKRLLDWFDLELAGEASDELGADFMLAETPDGWFVLVAGKHGFNLDEALAGVSSSRGFAVGAEISEGATFSRAAASRDGKRLWSVSYNDRGLGGLDASGDTPIEFEAIKAGLADREIPPQGDVGHLFEAPADLAARLTGYRAGGASALEWAALRKRQAGTGPTSRRPGSLRSAMFSELIPLLRSLRWETPDRPVLTDLGQIRRAVDGAEQTIWFEYSGGRETYIIVHFFVRACGDQPEFAVGGRVIAPRIRLPVWKRFTWKRLNELTRYEPPPDDVIGAVIDRAKEDIRIVDEYLRSWAPGPCIRIDYARPNTQWPSPLLTTD